MLIVNADDFGASNGSTDATIAAFDAGVVSSSSAMVWMRASSRAAELARERGLPLGLHLNLTLPFDAADVPLQVRERQLRLVGSFDPGSWREDTGERPSKGLLRDAVRDQLSEFLERYGEPAHLDGHHHVHVHAGVLAVLPRDLPIRPILRDPTCADAGYDRRERRLHRRFRTPALTVAFERLHPALGGVGLDLLQRARTDSLEVMTHPQQPAQLDALLGPLWRTALAGLAVGSYADLTASGSAGRLRRRDR